MGELSAKGETTTGNISCCVENSCFLELAYALNLNSFDADNLKYNSRDAFGYNQFRLDSILGGTLMKKGVNGETKV